MPALLIAKLFKLGVFAVNKRGRGEGKEEELYFKVISFCEFGYQKQAAIASSYCNTVTRSVATTEFFHFNGTLTTPWGSVEVKERNALPTNDPGVLR